MSDQSEFVCYLTLGWGVRGATRSAVRRMAEKNGVTLDPFEWPKMHELEKTDKVRVTGDAEKVEAFKTEFIERFNPV